MKQTERPFVTRILEFCGRISLWALPLLAVLWMLTDAERKASQTLINESRAELVQVLAQFQKLCDLDLRLETRIKKVISSLEQGNDCRSLVSQLARIRVEVFLFRASGKRLLLPGFSQEYQSLSERVLEVILGLHRDAGRPLGKSEGKWVESFLGDQAAARLLADSPGKTFDLSKFGPNKLAGWFEIASSSTPCGYLLVRLDSSGIPQTKVIHAACKEMSRLRRGKFECGWISLSDSPKEVGGEAAPISLELREEISRDRLEPYFLKQGRMFMTATLESGVRLFVARLVPRLPRTYQDWKLILAGFGLFLGLFSLWAPRHSLFSPTIRLRLVFLFGIAGGAGLLLLWHAASTYLATREQTLLRENRDQAFRLLHKIDTDFQNSLNASAIPFRKLVQEWEKRLAVNASAPSPAWNENLNDSLSSAFVADRTGSFHYFFNSDPSHGMFIPWDFSGKQGLSLIIRLAIGRFNGVSRDDEEKLKSASPVKLNHLMNLSVKALTRGNLEVVQSFMQGQVFNRFTGFARLPQGQAAGVLSVKFDTVKLEYQFLAQMFKRVRGMPTTGGSPPQLLALPKVSGGILPTIPRRLGHERDALRIQDAISQNGVFASVRGSYRGVPSHIFGIPGHFLPNYNLYLAFPFSPLQQELDNLANRFLGLGILTISFAAFLGFLISASLVQPMNELSKGIVRLTQSQFHDPVRVFTGDELQVISAGIEKIMEEMRELSVAHAIQEQLSPQAGLQGQGWFVKGWTRSPFEVSGEVFDYLLHPSGGVEFYVARIAGQSISSALEMAMTKMAIRVFHDLEIVEPARVLEAFQSHFGTALPFLKKLEVCFGIFDPASRRLRVSRVGRGTVVVLSGETPILSPEEMQTINANGHQPTVLWNQTFILPEGARVIVCSAGIPGTPLKDSETLGNHALPEKLSTLRATQAQEVGPALFTLLDNDSGERRLDTSQTLVVLQSE